MKKDDQEKLIAFRRYMGPSANGMKDSDLKKLAGWSSFKAGWKSGWDTVTERYKV